MPGKKNTPDQAESGRNRLIPRSRLIARGGRRMPLRQRPRNSGFRVAWKAANPSR